MTAQRFPQAAVPDCLSVCGHCAGHRLYCLPEWTDDSQQELGTAYGRSRKSDS